MAGEILERFGIADAPVPVEKIARGLGFEVLIASFGDPNIAGYVRLLPKPQIILSSSDPATRRAFTAAHEIGHFVLHKELLEKPNSEVAILYRKPVGGEKDPIEKEANSFAARLLVPEFLLHKYHSYDLTESQLAAIFGVSTEVMHYRLENSGWR